MKPMLTLLMMLSMLMITMVSAGCERKEGTFEDAGENLDEAVEEVKDEVDDATN